VKPVEVDGVEEWKVEKILYKRKIREVIKYLVQWKEFAVEYDTWKRGKNLENIKEVIKNKRSELNIFLFSFLIFIFFSIYFLLFYF